MYDVTSVKRWEKRSTDPRNFGNDWTHRAKENGTTHKHHTLAGKLFPTGLWVNNCEATIQVY